MEFIEEFRPENFTAILGASKGQATDFAAATADDLTFTGPLDGASSGLSVYQVRKPEIERAADVEVREGVLVRLPDRLRIGSFTPDDLDGPRKRRRGERLPAATRNRTLSEIMPEDEPIGMMTVCGPFSLLRPETVFSVSAPKMSALHPIIDLSVKHARQIRTAAGDRKGTPPSLNGKQIGGPMASVPRAACALARLVMLCAGSKRRGRCRAALAERF